MIVVNGERAATRPGQTPADVLSELGLTVTARGVAIAVNGEVVPRADWETFALPHDARVEVLTAMQGG
jgi:sulfur carrier protein